MRTLPVLLLLLTTASLRAEFLEVYLQISRMDCASCVSSLETGLRKIRGVSKVSVSQEKGAEFLLQPGNKITLERLRDAVKGVGFTPTVATVVVKGKPITTDGQWRFEVDGLTQSYALIAPDESAIKELRARNGQSITIKAVSPAPPDPRTVPALQVTSIVSTP